MAGTTIGMVIAVEIAIRTCLSLTITIKEEEEVIRVVVDQRTRGVVGTQQRMEGIVDPTVTTHLLLSSLHLSNPMRIRTPPRPSKTQVAQLTNTSLKDRTRRRTVEEATQSRITMLPMEMELGRRMVAMFSKTVAPVVVRKP